VSPHRQRENAGIIDVHVDESDTASVVSIAPTTSSSKISAVCPTRPVPFPINSAVIEEVRPESRARHATIAPCRARLRANLPPMQLVAPVTSASRPVTANASIWFTFYRECWSAGEARFALVLTTMQTPGRCRSRPPCDTPANIRTSPGPYLSRLRPT
jgi:hypothetical protein